MRKIFFLILALMFPCLVVIGSDFGVTISKGTFSKFHYGSGLGPGGGSPGTGTISISTPVQYQVFQRSGSSGSVTVTGTYTGNPNRIDARFNGGAWTTIVASPAGNVFSGSFVADQGQGTLEVRFGNNASITDSKSTIGVGEVFLVAGQSNAVGQGTNNQTYSSTDGLTATLFGNDYVWKNLTDPYDRRTGQIDTVSSDASAAGSWVVLLATEIMNNEHVPVAFIPSALSGSGIIEWQPGANHQDRTTLYGSAVYRTLQAAPNGIRAVLWHQGEHEANVGAGTNMTTAEYQGYFISLVNAFYTDLGVPTMAALLHNSSGLPDTNEGFIRTAVQNAAAANIHALVGPDLSDIASDDLYHLKTNAKLQTAADRWWAEIDSQLII